MKKSEIEFKTIQIPYCPLCQEQWLRCNECNKKLQSGFIYCNNNEKSDLRIGINEHYCEKCLINIMKTDINQSMNNPENKKFTQDEMIKATVEEYFYNKKEINFWIKKLKHEII